MENQVWEYDVMQSCASSLDDLQTRAIANKRAMDDAMGKLAAGVQAEVGAAFTAAYAEHVTSIEMFHQLIEEEAKLLRSDITYMQQNDAEIAANIRNMFGI